MQRYGLIDSAGNVVNVVAWDGDTSKWQPDPGLTAEVLPDSVGPRFKLVSGVWTAPAPAAPTVPETITNAQARSALRASGLFTQVSSLIQSQSQDVQDAWNFSPYLHRDSVLISSLAQALGLSSAQVDALFIAAGSITF